MVVKFIVLIVWHDIFTIPGKLAVIVTRMMLLSPVINNIIIIGWKEV